MADFDEQQHKRPTPFWLERTDMSSSSGGGGGGSGGEGANMAERRAEQAVLAAAVAEWPADPAGDDAVDAEDDDLVLVDAAEDEEGDEILDFVDEAEEEVGVQGESESAEEDAAVDDREAACEALLRNIPAMGVTEIDRRVHAFYYAWYGRPETDGAWVHWCVALPQTGRCARLLTAVQEPPGARGRPVEALLAPGRHW
jgi:hypothetical protein